MPPTTLLALMLATYAIPIAFVYYKYRIATDATAARSISSIITSKEPFITFSENAPPPIHHGRIPNPALHRSVYALDGGVHPSLRIPTMCHTTLTVVPLRHHRAPHRYIRRYFHPRTRLNPLHLRSHGILRDSRVYGGTYLLRRRHRHRRRYAPHPPLRTIPLYGRHRHRGHPGRTHFRDRSALPPEFRHLLLIPPSYIFHFYTVV